MQLCKNNGGSVANDWHVGNVEKVGQLWEPVPIGEIDSMIQSPFADSCGHFKHLHDEVLAYYLQD